MPTISIKSMLDAHVAANGKTWAHDRDLTVGASEVGQCLRKTWFAKNDVDPDPDYVDRYGARLRGDLIENHHWEPGIRAQLLDGVALLFAGQDQKTLVDGYLGGALAGVAAVGGLATLIDRSISAADAVGKTADKIGVGVEALQELRYAAQLAGVEQRTMDMALQRFTRRVAEAAKGTGEAKQALAQMGIALKDQHGNIRRAQDLLNDVAEAFRRTTDPAERLRLAFKLFDSEGVAMVNMLVGGAEALGATRRRARDLGIVLDEDLVRNAEKARDELDTLGKVISANLTRAVLDLAPVIADASSELADLASSAGVAYEQLKLLAQGDFNFEGLSLRGTKTIVEDLREDVRALATQQILLAPLAKQLATHPQLARQGAHILPR